MKRVGLLGTVLAFVIAAFAAATPAFAATQNLSGTVTTSINQTGTSYTDDSASNASNITGASNSTLLTLTHSSGNVTAGWTISATIGGLLQNGVALTFYVDATSNMGVASVTSIVFSDSTNANNTATLNLSIIGGTALDLTPTGALTISTNLANYTQGSAFNKSNFDTLTFTVSVGATGNKTFALDAVDVIDTPEPATIALFGLGLAGLGGGLLRRRRARRAAAARSAA